MLGRRRRHGPARGGAVVARGPDQLDRPGPHPALPHRRQRTRPGARRRPGARLGDACWPVIPGVGKSTLLLEVAHRWAAGRAARAVPVRRGVGRPDPDARRAHRLHPRRGLPGRRVRPADRARPHRRGAAQPGGRRLGADHVDRRRRRRDRRRHPGAGGDDGADGDGEVHRRRDDPRRPRHQGRRDRRARARWSISSTSCCTSRATATSALRMVRGVKNRFGAADEVGCFLLHDNGIECVADPSGLFLDQRPAPVPGTAVTVTLDGKRPLIGEVQALLGSPADEQSPRRAVSGIDSVAGGDDHRGAGEAGQLPIGANDIYLSTVGGMRLTDPSSDLAVAMAIASAVRRPPAADRPPVVIGEVGLAGDLRRVTGMDRRLAEAARLGFTVRGGSGRRDGPRRTGLRAIESATIGDALRCDADHRDRSTARSRDKWRADPTTDAWTMMAVKHQSTGPTVVQLARPTLRETIGRLAPGTALRDGLERILRGRTGALIVLGYDDSVEAICDGGFSLDVALRPDPAARAVEDGRRGGAVQRRQPHPAGQRPAGARPVDPHRRVRHPAPLRRAHGHPDRLSGDLGEPFDEHRHRLRGRRTARRRPTRRPSCRGPTRRSPPWSATRPASTRSARQLSTAEIEDFVTLRDVMTVVQRLEMVRRIGLEIDSDVVELGTDGRQLRAAARGTASATTTPPAS